MDTISLIGIGFLLLTSIFYGILFFHLKQAINRVEWTEETKRSVYRRIIVAFLLWATIISIASLSGFTGKFERFPLNVAPFMLIPLIAILVFTFSKRTKELLIHIPPAVLCHLQVFRVFVELLLWALFVQQQIPEQMTFEGRNLDILSGIFGLVVALLFIKRRAIVLLYNIAGLCLLVNIVATAILSMPTPIRVFMEEPANTIVVQWPFIFLPAFLVPLAYGLHFLSLRQLQLKS